MRRIKLVWCAILGRPIMYNFKIENNGTFTALADNAYIGRVEIDAKYLIINTP